MAFTVKAVEQVQESQGREAGLAPGWRTPKARGGQHQFVSSSLIRLTVRRVAQAASRNGETFLNAEFEPRVFGIERIANINR